jgi:uncharacterized protein involved in exopolysaccharide biosynthesis
MSAPPIPWKHIRNVLVLFAPVWIGAVVIFGMIGIAYALLSDDVYSARQPLVVRDEATRAADRLGRFASQTELKAAQETILEMAHNREVVGAALRQIGPATGQRPKHWPTIRDVDETIRDSVNVLAAQGSEFGNTEVVYLEVKAGDPDRAISFCNAIFENLTKHLRDVRRVRADSVIIELTHARDLAKEKLAEATERMREIEVKFGADLVELRNLNDTISAESPSRRALEETKQQLQEAQLELEKLESLHRLLVEAANDPQKLLISGGDLLKSQPSLQRLKSGLIDAQLRSSQLAGTLTRQNPKRKAAIATEREIRERMIQEASSVSESMEPTLRLQRTRVRQLQEKQQTLTNRLAELAEARSTYAEIDAELQQRTQQVSEAEERLIDARAIRESALSTNLVAELGPPQVSDKPLGPGASTVTLGSMMAGLLFGLGAVFLIAPGPTNAHGRRRWTDHVQGQNRRASDRIQQGQSFGRRASDRPPESPGTTETSTASDAKCQGERRATNAQADSVAVSAGSTAGHDEVTDRRSAKTS